MTDAKELPAWPPPESRAFFDTLVGVVREHDSFDAWHAKGRSAFKAVLLKAVKAPTFPHLGRLLCEAMDGPACRTFTPLQQWLVSGPVVSELDKHFYLPRKGKAFHPRAWVLTQLAERIGNRRMASMLLHIADGTTDSYDLIHEVELRNSAMPAYVARGLAAQSKKAYKSYGLEDIGELLSIELAGMRKGALVTDGEDGRWRLGPGVPPLPSFAVEPWLIDINTADASQLKVLPGMDLKLTRALIADRTERGPFASPAALLRLPALNPERVHAMRPYLTFSKA